MFESLKKKLANWIKGSENKPETKAKKSNKKSKIKKSKERAIKISGKKAKLLKTKARDEQLEKQIEQENIAEEIKEEVPLKFNAGTLKYEPDTEAIKQQFQEHSVEKKQSFFSKLISKIGKSKITQEHIDPVLMELELILLENNVALEVIDKIKAKISSEIVGKSLQKGKIESIVTSALKEAISDTLIEPPDLIKNIKAKQGVYKIILFGINGTGKTTSVAKLANYLKKHNISVALAAGDTFRAASIEQLEIHGQRLGVPVIKQNYGTDPAAVAFDAVKYAEKNHIKCLIIDTAGRMYTKENLLKEMEKIIRVTQPDLKLFVGEATTGNDSIEQAKTFNDTIGIDGIILAKADVDDKGGAALSVSSVTNKPIYFLGTGQGYDDLKPFKKSLILDNLELD